MGAIGGIRHKKSMKKESIDPKEVVFQIADKLCELNLEFRKLVDAKPFSLEETRPKVVDLFSREKDVISELQEFHSSVIVRANEAQDYEAKVVRKFEVRYSQAIYDESVRVHYSHRLEWEDITT